MCSTFMHTHWHIDTCIHTCSYMAHIHTHTILSVSNFFKSCLTICTNGVTLLMIILISCSIPSIPNGVDLLFRFSHLFFINLSHICSCKIPLCLNLWPATLLIFWPWSTLTVFITLSLQLLTSLRLSSFFSWFLVLISCDSLVVCVHGYKFLLYLA